MASKLLHSLADDNPDLQKQIGCMTGIFQLFDRHHIVTPRRISHKRLPPGNSHFNYESLERDSNSLHQRQATPDMGLNKSLNEKHIISTESSKDSFSSCSPSMSSRECKARADAPLDRISFPETPMRDSSVNQTSTSPHSGSHSLDLRNVVKDSMYREARSLSSEEAVIRALKHRDSPRPPQLSKSVNGKHNVPIDLKLKESIRVLNKLRDAPLHYGEAKELPRLSYEVIKDRHRHSISKDAPRFSYDGRGTSRLSFESPDNIQCAPKLKELPRLSLDSRESSWRKYSSDSKGSHLPSNFNTGSASTTDDRLSSLHQSSATQSRPPSVVAKLMGLETLPEFYLANEPQSSLNEIGCSTKDNGQFSKNGSTRPLRVSKSLNGSLKEHASPRWKDPDLVVKSISTSRFPNEPAPWKQQDGTRSSQKPSSRAKNASARIPDSFPSVYGEIEMRLKDLEFKQSGRDLRALKQILEAMQVKGLLDGRKEKQASNVVGNQRDSSNVVGNQRDYEPKLSVAQNSMSARQQTIRGSDSARTFEPPIVIMKPATLVEKSGISDSHKLIGDVHTHNKKGTTFGGIAKDRSPRNSFRDASTGSSNKKVGSSKTIKSAQSQPRSQQFQKENSPSSVKNPGSVSPRMQQKKLDLERRSRPPTPSSDSYKPGRQSSKQTTESDSPGRRLRPKVPSSQHSDDQLSEISNESRSFQGDEISMQSDSIIVDSKMDMEVTRILQSAEIIDSQSLSMKAVEQLVSGPMKKKSILMLDEDEYIAELDTDAPDHPSPVSVLDASVYKDDVPSPVKIISNAPKADDAQESKESETTDHWNPADSLSVNSTGSGEINREKLQSIDHLVQKLRRLNSSHDEARIDYIGSLCENTNPDHRYISEILLASGLLLRDLSSELPTFQHHSSGHLINPELFLVLEQTKVSSLLSKEESVLGKAAYMKLNSDKFHRKLIFDAVNEILGAKLGSYPEPWLKPNGLTKKIHNAQMLLKELCFEIGKIQPKKPECCLEDEGDGLKSMLREDVMHRSESWTDFHCEIPEVVLHVERLIFKDLVDEIVIGEAASLRVKSRRLRNRKLFGK